MQEVSLHSLQGTLPWNVYLQHNEGVDTWQSSIWWYIFRSWGDVWGRVQLMLCLR